MTYPITSPEKTLVFIDTEFTSLAFMDSIDPGSLPHLLSIGLVTQGGREFYGELMLNSDLLAQCSDFVKASVVSQFDKKPASYASLFELGCRVNDFLADLHAPIQVIHDHSVDWKLLVRLLDQVDPMARLRLVRKNVWQPLRESKDLASFAKRNSLATSAQEGLMPHHALADARALKAASEAVMHSPAKLPALKMGQKSKPSP